MLELFSFYIVELLKLSREYILLYSLPTNPLTGIIYTGIAYYGYFKLKKRVDLDLSKYYNKILVFLYSVSLLGFINFCLENVWLTSFFVKYTFLNVGWLEHIYFNVPSGWFVNYLRNFVFMIVLYLVSSENIKHLNFNKKTAVGFIALSIYIIAFFMLSPNYAYIDWTYAIANNYPNSAIITSFMLSMCGKPLLFYIFYSLFLPKPRITRKSLIIGCGSKGYGMSYKTLTLDVGCGSRPKGDVNIDLLEKDSDPLKYNLLQKKNFVVNTDKVPNFIRADARSLPFQDKTFNKSFCYHLMEHISEDQKVYDELKRVSSEEIEIRVPLGIWEDLFNTVFWFKGLQPWRKKHHLRSYSKKMWMKSLLKVFEEKEIFLSYGYLSFLKGLKFELDRKTRFPFPFPFELVAYINYGVSS